MIENEMPGSEEASQVSAGRQLFIAPPAPLAPDVLRGEVGVSLPAVREVVARPNGGGASGFSRSELIASAVERGEATPPKKASPTAAPPSALGGNATGGPNRALMIGAAVVGVVVLLFVLFTYMRRK